MQRKIFWIPFLFLLIAIAAAGLSLPALSIQTSNRVLPIAGKDSLKLDTPMGVAADGSRIYVANAGQNQITVFDEKGKPLFQIGRAGTREGELNYPVAVALSQAGDVYVADFYNQRIQAFSKKGEFRFSFPKTQRIKPAALAVDSKGNVYVADVESQSIKIFSGKGELVREFGEAGETPGKFKFPNGIAVDPAGEKIYVADSQNHRIQVFTKRGEFLKAIQLKGMELPKGIFYSDDRLYVADSLIHKILVFDLDGKLVETIGKEEGTFHFPNDVFVENGKIYIADRGSNQVVVFSK